MIDLDIIVYAIVAVLIFARLWTTLGERGEDEPQNPNPFAKSPEKDAQKPEAASPEAADKSVAFQPYFSPSAPAESLAGALERIAQRDPNFDEKKFLQGAKAAFKMIVEDFARGDLSRIGRFIAPTVRYGFEQALIVRKEQGEVLEAIVQEVSDADVSAARIEGDNAFLTVSFVSRQINITRDAEGKIISGEGNRAEEIRDTWVFARDLRSDDPNWQLVETRS